MSAEASSLRWRAGIPNCKAAGMRRGTTIVLAALVVAIFAASAVQLFVLAR